MNSEFYVRTPGSLRLADYSTQPASHFEKEDIKYKTSELDKRVERLFDLLYFAGENSLLIVLQGMDAAGKDGTIRHILGASHAQSSRVASFGVPTEEELAHDFLWRCHKQTPGRGEICLFNRSHYEDVGVVRVHNIVPKEIWSTRFSHINNFETLLADKGTIILKIWLHISSEEQEQRLREREEDPDAAWKLNAKDWQERKFWNDYQKAYSDAIGKCSAEHAPWLVVPADSKWYRNYVVSQAIIETLEKYEDGWNAKLHQIGEQAKAELASMRSTEKSILST